MNQINLDDINLFSNVIKTLAVDQKNYYYIPYFISSPRIVFKENKKNDAYLPLYILVLNKTNLEDYRIEKVDINWHAIHYYQTFTYVTEDFNAKKLEEITKYKKYFKTEDITINPNETKFVKLKDVIKEGFYKDLKSTIDSKLENEYFLEFKSNGKKYFISAIEVVRYFYAKAEKDSLLNVLFHIEGTRLLYNNISVSSTNINLYLKNDCSKDDAIYALYFIHKNDYEEQFNEIFLNLKSEDYLYANIPSLEPITIRCRTIIQGNSSLIIRVIDSTMLDKLSNMEISITHPNDKDVDRTQHTKNKSKPKKVETEPDDEFDGEVSSIPLANELTVIENESSSLEKKELNIKFEKDKTEKKKPTNITSIEKSPKNKLTPNDGKGSKKEGTKVQLTTTYYPENFEEVSDIKYFNSIDKIIKIFKNKYSYSVSVKSYYFPDKKTTNGKTKKVAVSFTDKDKKNRRRYILIKFESSKNNNFFFLDVEEKFENQKKEILTIKKDISLDDCQQRYIIKMIYDQVKDGNHRWLLNNKHGLLSSEVYTFGHKYNKIEDLCERIFNIIN
ncbi:hypothetical protein OZZ08_03860 [Malaciobacter mytili]|uniref:hypothetical protein n=1 Tax=Malaciobacter mytili TaxID=603050 RepID=UPI003BAE5D19